MRNAFIDELVKLARENLHIFLVVGDLGFSVVEPFAEAFPDRFLNAGVAEQNMTGLAAGLASEGYHVFTYSIANFPTFRCAEQIRNDIAYHNLPVTVVSVGGGLAYGNLGYSHHAVQDYALLRCFPNVVIASPGDPHETRACLRYLVAHPQPSYLRLGKAGEPLIHQAVPNLTPGKWVAWEGNESGATCTFLSTGATLDFAVQLAKSRELNGVWSVHSVPFWGDDFREEAIAPIQNFKHVIAIEDHLRSGGFGAFLRESMEGRFDLYARLSSVAIDHSVCSRVGNQHTLNAAGGLNKAHILRIISEIKHNRR